MKSPGFTLVELAVSLVIVGLIIGGILKGQEMIMLARVNATIQEVNAFRAAHTTFMDTYDGAPGDFARAATRLPGCDGTTVTACQNGNGDSLIGADLTPPFSWFADSFPEWFRERTQYWRHLVLADLLSGVSPNLADIMLQGWGVTHPHASIGGGYHVTRVAIGGASKIKGQYFYRIQGAVNLSNGVIAPKYMQMIDVKIDDGISNTGSVSALATYLPGEPCADMHPGWGINYVVSSGPVCTAYFMF